MDVETAETLPLELDIALAYTPTSLRDRLRTYFALDQRLARIVAATSEPMLGQMRLAWWRDMLATDASSRPAGDAVLEAIGRTWAGHEMSLSRVVDGWEVLVVAEQLGPDEIETFSRERSAAFSGLIDSLRADKARLVNLAAARWACADAASKVSDRTERNLFLSAGLAIPTLASRLPKPFRGLAVLNALSTRSLKRGGTPLMDGRGAAISTLRAALIRR